MQEPNGIVGKKIAEVRLMNEQELEDEGWDEPAPCIVLEDGTKLYPARDEEGNGAGAMFGVRGKESFRLI